MSSLRSPDPEVLFVALVIDGEAIENWMLRSPIRPNVGEVLVIEGQRFTVTGIEFDFPQMANDGKYPHTLTFIAVEAEREPGPQQA